MPQLIGISMVLTYVNVLTALIQCLNTAESALKYWKGGQAETRQQSDEMHLLLAAARNGCRDLGLKSAEKQARRVQDRMQTGQCSFFELGNLVRELRTRIHDDLEEHIFFRIDDPQKVMRFFRPSENPPAGTIARMEFKDIDEIFDPAICAEFPEALDDLNEAAACFVFSRYSACLFHLMRVVEVGVRRMAKMAGIEDPAPSWGAVLKKVEKNVLRTPYDELPAEVKPNIAFLRDLLPKMQAIQHAWRNRFSHVELAVPDGAGREDVASEVLNAVNAFMRLLSLELAKSARP